MSSDLDKAFELIKKGNAFEKSGNHWGAADSYGHAMMLLQQLANSSGDDSDEEQCKIHRLYTTKSREYRKCARECLIKALVFEKEQDSQSEELPLAAMVSDAEAGRRADIFSMLYSRTVEEDAGEKTSKLEERLMELNASLPSGFKTDTERLKDINRGLNRLGLSLYSSSDHQTFSVEPPASEEAQVEQIIAQAQDEVNYTKPEQHKPACGSSETSVDASDSEDDDSVDQEDTDDESILKNKKAIRRKVVKAQAKLAEFIALVNPNPKEVSEDDLDDTGKDEDDSEKDESEENDAGFDLEYARLTLAAARNYLNRALKEWSENS
jgi:hypothetical protein